MNGQIVQTKDGLWAIQSANNTKPFLNKMREAELVELTKDDIVADIGAYIGEYSTYAADRCKQVYAYEACPDTAAVLRMNYRENIEVINKAVVGDDRPDAELFLSKGIGATNSVVKSHAKAGSVVVPAIRYEKALRDATVVKIDVEGAEYSYDIIQPQLRAIIIEFHPLSKRDWQSMALFIMDQIASAGFEALAVPQFKNGWDMHATFVRR